MWPLRGGIAHFAASMARSLVARGHDVRAVTFARQYPALLFPGKTQIDDGPAPAGVPRADATRSTRWTRGRGDERPAASPKTGRTSPCCTTGCRSSRPQLGGLARALRRRGVRVVTVVHNALPHEPGPLDRPLARYAMSRGGCARRAERERPAGRRAAGRACADHRCRAPGVRPLRRDRPARRGPRAPRPARRRARPAVLRLRPPLQGHRRPAGRHAGCRARVCQACASSSLASSMATRPRSARSAAPLGAAVRFDADYIPDARVADYFGAADAVVQPYLSATQSGVAGIAFHFGRAVVTTDVGGLAADVGTQAWSCRPDDPVGARRCARRDAFRQPPSASARSRSDSAARASWDDLSAAVEAASGTEMSGRSLIPQPAHTLKRNSITSPSATVYSLPSHRIAPASRTAVSVPSRS